MLVVDADEPMDPRFEQRTMRETQAGREATQHETVLDDVHPKIPALFAKMHPAAVIISPSRLLSGLSPVVASRPLSVSPRTALSDRMMQNPLNPDVEL